MEKLYKSDIYKSVKAFLDELSENDAAFMLTDKDTQSLEGIMDSVAPLSVRNVHIGAPNWMLAGEALSPTSENFSIHTDLIGEYTLPDKFMRLVSAKLSSWGAPVTRIITEDSAEYRMQANEYMRGTPSKPVCALVRGATGEQKLELYSAKTSSDTLSLSVIYEPAWMLDLEENEQYIDICPRLKNSIIAQITGQLLLALNENERAQTFLSLSSNYSQ